MARNWIKSLTNKVSEYFENSIDFQNSLGYLMIVMKNSYAISVGVDQVYNGIKDSKRFKICILQLIFMLIFAFQLLIFFISSDSFSLIDGPFLPDHFRPMFFTQIIGFLQISMMRIDITFSEMGYNLSPLKVFYYLINDLTSQHKLTDKNDKRLAIFSKIPVNFLIYCGGPSIIIFLSIYYI